jgi:hypothetical protein
MDPKGEEKPAAEGGTPEQLPEKLAIPEAPKASDILVRVMRGDDTLTDAELEAAGVDADTRKAFRDGAASRKESAVAAAAAEVGGPQQFNAMMAWAQSALSAEEKAAFNKLVDKGNAAERRLAVNGLAERYRREGGAPGKTFFGGGKAPAGAQPFLTTKEVTTAMRDPKWTTDESYRQQVRERLKVTRMSDLNQPQRTRN